MFLRIVCFSVTVMLVLTGCSMVTSYNTWLLPDGGSPRQNGGAYYLPKHILVVTVTQRQPEKPPPAATTTTTTTTTGTAGTPATTGNGGTGTAAGTKGGGTGTSTSTVTKGGTPAATSVTRSTIVETTKFEAQPEPFEISIVRKSVSDGRYLMNLGFNLSPTSNDDIEVKFSEGGLLNEITASADDKTKDIILNLTKAIFSSARFIASEQADGLGVLPTKLLQVAFDPFNEEETYAANKQLSRFGYCVAFAQDPRNPEPENCPLNARGGHGHHDWHASTHHGYKERPKDKVPVTGEGVYFRQPVEHKIQVFQKNPPHCKGWCARWDGYAAFANEGALLRVDIDRTIFVKRETAVKFGPEGVPTSVRVKKPSELLAASTLPLEITKVIIEAPLEAITSKTTVVKAQQGYISEQAKLLKAQTDYIDQINARLKAGQPLPRGYESGAIFGASTIRSVADIDGANRSVGDDNRAIRARFYQYCTDIGLDQGGCDAEWKKTAY